jgi:YD repeat-containing protein
MTTTDRDGRRCDYAYEDGRLVSEKWYDASGALVETLSWSYDLDGNLLSATSSAGTYSFRYDGAGRVVHVDEPFGLSLDFTYDLAGNRVLVVDSFGGSVASTYDGNELVSRVFSQPGQPTLRIDFLYDLVGQVVSEARYSDAAGTTVVATTALGYDAAGRLLSEEHDGVGGKGQRRPGETSRHDLEGRGGCS